MNANTPHRRTKQRADTAAPLPSLSILIIEATGTAVAEALADLARRANPEQIKEPRRIKKVRNEAK